MPLFAREAHVRAVRRSDDWMTPDMFVSPRRWMASVLHLAGKQEVFVRLSCYQQHKLYPEPKRQSTTRDTQANVARCNHCFFSPQESHCFEAERRERCEAPQQSRK